MENLREILLKLHYLPLEIHTIYQIMKQIRSHDKLTEEVLKSILGHSYPYFKRIDLDRMLSELRCEGMGVLTILDDDYPVVLEPIHMPPLVLFTKGDLTLLNKTSLAVIGTRSPSTYGESACRSIVKDLVKKNVTIISGLARGIDGIAHKEAIAHGGRTIAVLGGGFHHIYPKEHEALAKTIGEEHLLLSEYPPKRMPEKTHFPFRNRIVSGLSDGVVVIEAAKRSGTLITCEYALDQGKEIYAVPGSIFSKNSEGTHNLIQQGAKLINHSDDILV